MPEQINIIHEFISDLIGDPALFKPNKQFYKKTGIGQKRWGLIYRNDKSPTLKELEAIASYFDKHISVITDKRQLKLFEE